MNPTPLTSALVALCALSALVVPVDAAVSSGALVLVVAGVDAALARARPRLRRGAMNIVPRGVAVPFVVSVLGPGVGRVRVRQPRTPDLRIEPPEAAGDLHAHLVALRRGRHTLPDVAARRRGPLGLAAWNFKGEGSAEIIVYPDVPRARRIATAVRQGRFADAGRLRRGPLGLGTEFESIRDYQPDDDLRQINWAATSRAGRPMSNQFRVEQDRDVVALVDTGRLMSAPLGDHTRLDAAVDAVAAVAAVTEVLGDRCGVIAFDREIRRSIPSRRLGERAVLAAIHDLEPRPFDSDYELAFRTVRNTKRALIIVFTDVLDDTAARSLLRAVPVLARRHAVMVVSATDHQIEAMASASANTARHGWERAVALDVLETRTEVVQRLRSVAASFVEAPTHLLAEATVREYLRLKSRARL